MVVVILHDHGSRYVGKVYNAQWMMERGFLDVKTFKTSYRAGAPNAYYLLILSKLLARPSS